MRLYLLGFIALLLLSGCGSSPEATLSPKLSHYTTSQQQCSDFIDGKNVLTNEVEKECELFLKRLDTSNTTANELSSGKLKKGEAKETKIRYARERNKLKQQYAKLSSNVKKATLAAIKKDDIQAFEKGVAFPGNIFIAPYYEFMKDKAPKFDNNKQYISYKHIQSEKLMLKGHRHLTQGKKNKALVLFEAAAEMGNVQAARETALLYEKRDSKKALHWHSIAANANVTASYLNLAQLYDAEGKRKTALKWYFKAAENNNAKAQYQLYIIKLKSNQNEAHDWLKKSALNAYPHAQYQYALFLMDNGSTDKAIDMMTQASQNNYILASSYLGKYYYDHKFYGRAFAQLKQNDSASSFYLQAKMYEEGAGTIQDYAKAYTFYTRADALGKNNVDKDMQRVKSLLNQEQQRVALEESKKQALLMAAMKKQCGSIPTPDTIKKADKMFHIIGTASAPLSHNSFIIYGNDGEDYYILKTKNIHENDKVNIAVKSSGITAEVNSADDEESVDIYEFTFIKKCAPQDIQ